MWIDQWSLGCVPFLLLTDTKEKHWRTRNNHNLLEVVPKVCDFCRCTIAQGHIGLGCWSQMQEDVRSDQRKPLPTIFCLPFLWSLFCSVRRDVLVVPTLCLGCLWSTEAQAASQGSKTKQSTVKHPSVVLLCLFCRGMLQQRGQVQSRLSCFFFQQVVIVVESKTRTEVEHVGFKVVYRWMGAKSWFYMVLWSSHIDGTSFCSVPVLVCCRGRKAWKRPEDFQRTIYINFSNCVEDSKENSSVIGGRHTCFHDRLQDGTRSSFGKFARGLISSWNQWNDSGRNFIIICNCFDVAEHHQLRRFVLWTNLYDA